MHPVGTDSPCGRIPGRQGRVDGCAARRPVSTGGAAIERGRTALRGTFGGIAGHDGTKQGSLIEAGAVAAGEAVAVAGEASQAIR